MRVPSNWHQLSVSVKPGADNWLNVKLGVVDRSMQTTTTREIMAVWDYKAGGVINDKRVREYQRM